MVLFLIVVNRDIQNAFPKENNDNNSWIIIQEEHAV